MRFLESPDPYILTGAVRALGNLASRESELVDELLQQSVQLFTGIRNILLHGHRYANVSVSSFFVLSLNLLRLTMFCYIQIGHQRILVARE